MKNKWLIILVCVFITNLCPAQEFDKEEKIIGYLQHHRFNKIHRHSDKSLKKALSSNRLKKVWLDIEKQFGPYQSHGKPLGISGADVEKSITLLYFKKGSMDLETTFNSDEELTGIFFKPKAYTLPDYGKYLNYYKEDIAIVSGNYTLPGEIMLPKDLSKKVPLVIFIHGSGANDRYVGIGPVKVFKDLSLGLLNEGIACMVYDKRTLVYKKMYDTAQFTLWDETVEDAVNAFRLAKTKDNIDTNRIYIAGHSQGGYALPLILKHCPGIKGGISLAGCSRPLDELMEDQYHYLTRLDGKVTLSEKMFLKKEMKKIRFVRSEKLFTSKPKAYLLGYWPTLFWRDIKTYDPLSELKALDVPVLFLQGDRDYQVTDKDFAKWKSAYLEKKYWSFISYSKLNHLFIEGEGKPNPYEYWNGGNIPQYVIKDMVDWIKKVPD